MAYTDADRSLDEQRLAAIRTAMATGELEVEFVDRRVRYRSIAELKAAEIEIVRRLARTRPKQVRAFAGKGL